MEQTCGAWLVAGDGQLLGKVSGNPYSTDSIINESGKYGSTFSSTSIWNSFGRYGGASGQFSAFNDFALSPPALVKGANVLGSVTTAAYLPRRVSPLDLKAWLAAGNCEYE